MFDYIPLDGWESAAHPEQIVALEQGLGITLPDDYKAFLKVSNGYNGEIGLGYAVLWGLPQLADLALGYNAPARCRRPV